ncbi:hypothetical protein K523DRAFT_204769, partial [Schizophyllum commune Tattone D]
SDAALNTASFSSSTWMMEGRSIYDEFSDVVILREQMRVVDDRWRAFLSRLRNGDDPSWSQPFLVTPRHSVRNEWNGAAMRGHCASSGQRLYICPAEDTGPKGRPLTLAERLAVVRRSSQGSKPNARDLPREVLIAVGALVLVTQNIDTNLDIANGARGHIERIVFDPREPDHGEEGSVVHLRYMPKYVLVKLERTR